MVRGPVRKQSMDPVHSGGPRTGGQSFRVTLVFVCNLGVVRKGGPWRWSVDRSVSSQWTRSVVGVHGPGVSLFGSPLRTYLA